MTFHPQLFAHTHTRTECNNYGSIQVSAWTTEVCHLLQGFDSALPYLTASEYAELSCISGRRSLVTHLSMHYTPSKWAQPHNRSRYGKSQIGFSHRLHLALWECYVDQPGCCQMGHNSVPKFSSKVLDKSDQKADSVETSIQPPSRET